MSDETAASYLQRLHRVLQLQQLQGHELVAGGGLFAAALHSLLVCPHARTLKTLQWEWAHRGRTEDVPQPMSCEVSRCARIARARDNLDTRRITCLRIRARRDTIMPAAAHTRPTGVRPPARLDDPPARPTNRLSTRLSILYNII